MVICDGGPELWTRLQRLFMRHVLRTYQAQMDHGRVVSWVEALYAPHDDDGGGGGGGGDGDGGRPGPDS